MAIFAGLLLGKTLTYNHSNYRETSTNYQRKIAHSYIMLSTPAKGFPQSLDYSLFQGLLKIMLFGTLFKLFQSLHHMRLNRHKPSCIVRERLCIDGQCRGYCCCLEREFQKKGTMVKTLFERFYTWVSGEFETKFETIVLLQYYCRGARESLDICFIVTRSLQ